MKSKSVSGNRKSGTSDDKQLLRLQGVNLDTSNQVVVAVGASAGGLEALQDFFKAVPNDNGLAFVVIQHLSPDYKSMMDELLARHTKMMIHVIEDGMRVEPNSIYLIPPRKNLTIFHDQLFLEDYNLKKGLNLPIDIFFRSLAQEKGKNGIGIILSGTGSDGALGTRAIKEAAGMIMVQDEESAKFDGMPRSSIATGLVDFILPPDKMPDALLNYIKHPYIQKNNAMENILKRDYDSLTKVILILRDFCGIDFSYYKGNTIIRRLERRVSINRCNSLEEYLLLLSQSDKEKETLFRDLLIGVTRFFRDPEAFQVLNDKVIPAILDSKPRSLRIWSTGCSTGEEVYSLAMLISECIERLHIEIDIKIFATDIDRQSLTIASQGYYPDNIMVDIDAVLLNKYFNRIEGGYQVKESIRRMVVFATHNLLKDPPFSKLDLLICRNLFIYLKSDIQHKLLSMFYNSLSPAGYLFMGSSESIGEMTEAFHIVDGKNKIFRIREGYKPAFVKELGSILPAISGTNDSQIHSSRILSGNKADRLLEKIVSIHMPPGFVIDSNDNIIQIIGDVNRFITLNSGKFSQNLFSVLPENFGLYVSGFLRRLKKTRQSIRSDNFMEMKDLNPLRVKLEGHYIETDKNQYYLISFITDNEENKINGTTVGTVAISEDYSERIHGLERELQLSREALQATIEELETSNEELQSSNEELIASNEELQSTNEELQSVNEELYTVNSEYQIKIDELERLNNDITNLINNTEIGALYLDRNLCIRKITPVISKITNIIPSDLGRPISHIASFNYNQPIMDDILKVTETLQIIENEYKDEQGNFYLVRTRPYRVDNNAVDGILVTFVGINSFKNEQQNSTLANKRLNDSMDVGHMAWWEWDVKSNKVIFDAKKATMIGYTVEEFPEDVYKICELIHPDDYEYTMQVMRDHLYGKSENYTVTYRIKRKDGSYAWYFDRGAISERSETGSPLKVIGTVIDVSILKSYETELHSQNYLLKKAFDIEQCAKFIVDANGSLIYSNDAFTKLYEDAGSEKLFSADSSFIFVDKYGKIIENKNPLLDLDDLNELEKDIHIYFVKNKNTLNIKVLLKKICDAKNNLQGVSVTILN